MRLLGIGVVALGLAVAVYSYGVGFGFFLAGILVMAAGFWLAIRGSRAHSRSSDS